jgi:hypothetical protein
MQQHPMKLRNLSAKELDQRLVDALLAKAERDGVLRLRPSDYHWLIKQMMPRTSVPSFKGFSNFQVATPSGLVNVVEDYDAHSLEVDDLVKPETPDKLKRNPEFDWKW